jgi:hypothetical protein
MRGHFAEENQTKRAAIAVSQQHALKDRARRR